MSGTCPGLISGTCPGFMPGSKANNLANKMSDLMSKANKNLII
jgi:TctA family transporter